MNTLLIILVTIGVIGFAGVSSVRLVKQHEKKILTVQGSYKRVLEPGVNIVPPFISKTHSFDMRTKTIQVPYQESITTDNKHIRIADFKIYMKVINVEKCFQEVDNVERAVSNLTQTTLRSLVGKMNSENLDEQKITVNVEDEISDVVQEWGVRIESIESGSLTIESAPVRT